MELLTNRLTLKQWSEDLRDPFAKMNFDDEVVGDLGGPYDRAKSDRKFDRYREPYDVNCLSRWALTDLNAQFVGYAGVIKNDDLSHPIGEHWDIG
jgi:RimJ/RimL family protein N-acetyltransferase